jgi:hypothetical protein
MYVPKVVKALIHRGGVLFARKFVQLIGESNIGFALRCLPIAVISI